MFIIRMFRRFYKVIGVSLWTLYVAIRVFPSYLGKSYADIYRCSRMTRIWTTGLSRVLGIRVSIRNPQYAPKERGGFILSNHLSYLDVMVHSSLMPVRFAPKAEIRRWPVIGFVVGLSRPVWIDRENRQKSEAMSHEFEETLAHGISLLVYPEGTTTDGTSLLPFKTPPFEAPISVGAHVHMVVTRYRPTPEGKTLCWYGDMSLVPHLWMAMGQKHIDVEIEWLEPVKLEPGMDRKTVAAELHDKLLRELERVLKLPFKNAGQPS